MPTFSEQNLSSFVINEVDSDATFEAMKAAGLVKEGEFYLTPDMTYDSLIFDDELTEGSQNMVKSGVIYDAIKNIPTPDVSGQIELHNEDPDAHESIRNAVSAAQRTADSKATMDQVNEAISAIPTPDVSGQIEQHNTSEEAHSNMGWIRVTDEEIGEAVPIDADTLEGKTVQQIVDMVPTPDVSGDIQAHNESSTAHSDIRAAVNNAQNAASNAASTASAAQAAADNAASAAGALSRFNAGLGNEYLWEKSKTESEYVVKRKNNTTDNITSTPNDLEPVYSYSSNISVDNATGVVSLVNPATIQRKKYNASDIANAIRGKYFSVTNIVSGNGQIPFDGIYFCNTVTSREDNFCLVTNYDVITSELVLTKTVYGYVNSSDPNAYPANDGYTYTPLGMLGDKAIIETGSYVGTGTYGASNPNSLTFDFAPKLIIAPWMNNGGDPTPLDQSNTSSRTIVCDMLSQEYKARLGFGTVTNLYAKKSSDGRTISWYANSDGAQQNSSGIIFHYVAIG